MTGMADANRLFGDGPLARAAALVYTLMVVEAMFALAAAPGLVALTLLDRDASNIPLAALCALPLGPAFSAALYALARRSHDLTDLRPVAAFWRGYRLNAGGVLRIWIPFLVVLTVFGVNLSHLDAAGVPTWWGVALGLLAVVASLWVANALVITSLFSFRAVDIARLAAYFLVHRFSVTVATFCLLVVATGVIYLSSEGVLMLAGSVLAALLLVAGRPMLAEVEEKFTA
jgi:hypothetical protein